MTSEPELKPCPFCGGEAEISSHNIHESGDFRRCIVVKCRDNECCKVAEFTKWGYENKGMTLIQAREKAIKAWNTRADPEKDRVMRLMAEALENVALIKTVERIKEDIKAMEGGLCPSFDQTVDMVIKFAKRTASNALSEYAKIEGEL